MRLTVSLLLIAAMFLTSCAYQGVIVEKHSRAHPLYHSVGIEGVYTFVLRDQSGALHRQMVTPDVFEAYAEGDYFNDLQPAAPSRAGDFKQTRTAEVSAPKPTTRTAAAAARKTPTRTASTTRAATPRSQKGAKAKAIASNRATKQSSRTKPENKQTAWTSRAAGAKPKQSKAAPSSRQTQRTGVKAATAKSTAAPAAKANARSATKQPAKPWKLTEPTVETAPSGTAPQPPAEGPAVNAAPAAEMPPSTKPSASPEPDIVYIPPQPR